MRTAKNAAIGMLIGLLMLGLLVSEAEWIPFRKWQMYDRFLHVINFPGTLIGLALARVGIGIDKGFDTEQFAATCLGTLIQWPIAAVAFGSVQQRWRARQMTRTAAERVASVRRGRIAKRAMSLLVLMYIASYIPNSLSGGWVPAESGNLRPFGMLAEVDQFQWMPRYGWCQTFRHIDGEYGLRGDLLGHIYSPLILLDQKLTHRTIRFVRDDYTVIEPIPAPPLEEYHPTLVNHFGRRFPYRSSSGKSEDLPNNGPSVQVTRDAKLTEKDHRAGSLAPQP